MHYRHDIESLSEDSIGKEGLSPASLSEHYSALSKGIGLLQQWRDENHLPMLRLPDSTEDLDEIEEVAAWFRQQFAHVLVIGTGGSSLGGQTLAALKENPYHAPKKQAPRLWFLDNVDPHSMNMLLESLDLSQIGCLVISKSGGTAEIIAQTLIVLDAMEKSLGKAAISQHFVSITEPKDNPLRRLSSQYNIRTLEHDPKIGGRFSVLSRVGLIPAAIAGLDIRALRQGANNVLQATLQAVSNPQDAPAAIGAAVNFAYMQRNRNIAVLMPYCDRLAYFGMWYRQLWAESLGKDGKGSTPVRALGTVDQHSQLQLYLDGPKDKLFTLIHPAVAGQGPLINGDIIQEKSLSYINGQRIGDVMAAYQQGTSRSLHKNHCPVRHIWLETVDESSLGALLMHFMLETILTAHLMGVDAFDQPAVEDSKIFAREYLSQHPAKATA